MWFFKDKAAAKEVVIGIRVNGVSVKEKTARKSIRKALNKISKEEMEILIEQLHDKEWVELRVTKVEAGKFLRMPSIFLTEEGNTLCPREDYNCCGPSRVCGQGCARGLTGTDYWSDTNLGLIPDSTTDTYSDEHPEGYEEDY